MTRERRLRELSHRIRTVALDRGEPILAELSGELARCFDADADASYRYDEDAATGHAVLGALSMQGFTRRSLTMFESIFSNVGTAAMAWSGRRVERSQRNRALTLDQIERITGRTIAQSPAMRDVVIRENGLTQQLRALVCDGATLLSFVAVFRRTPFDAGDRRAFARILRPLEERLRYEAHWEEGRLARLALPAVLDAVPTPALLLDARGNVRAANAAGRAWAAEDRRARRQWLCDAVSGRNPAASLTRIETSGLPNLWLFTIRGGTPSFDERVHAAATRWCLTRRQRQVLPLLARGAPNKSIATELGCSTGTIELHVSAILAKAQLGSRTEAIAAILQGR